MTQRVDNPSKPLKFECTGCGECCKRRGSYAYVYVNDDEVDRLARHLEITAGEFRARHTFVDELGWEQFRFDRDECPFLDVDTNRCTVYEARPSQCRTFPFWRKFIAGGEWTAEVASMCEGIGQGEEHSPGEIRRRLEEKDARDAEDG